MIEQNVSPDGADRDAQAPMVMAGDRRRSQADIRIRADRAAEGLKRSGVGEGDAVALLLRNDIAFFEASLAAARAGASPVPVNWHAAPAETAYILSDCGAKVLIGHEDLLGPVLPHLPPGVLVLAVETPKEIRAAFGLPPPIPAPREAAGTTVVPLWDAWLEQHPPIAAPAEALRSAIIYTSGTTGLPKGVRRSAAAPSGPPSRALTVYGFDRPEPATVLITGPLYHSVPNACGRLAFGAGADLVLQPRFSAEETLDLIARHRVTHLHLVPAMMVRLLALPEALRRDADVSSLRHVVHGAAPCPVAVKRAMIEWWGPVIHEYYGSTETGLLTCHDSAEALSKPGTVGRALPGIALHVLDGAGRPQPPGIAGDIYAGSPTLQDFTYIGRAESRAAIGRGNLVTAGDVGWLDAEGYLYLGDRKRDVILSGGTGIYPAEIEAVLLALPGVADCAVIGVPDRDLGQGIEAFVVLLDGTPPSAERLRHGLAGLLPPEKVPRRIEIVPALPREDSGKIFKERLRDRAMSPEDVGSGASRRLRPGVAVPDVAEQEHGHDLADPLPDLVAAHGGRISKQ